MFISLWLLCLSVADPALEPLPVPLLPIPAVESWEERERGLIEWMDNEQGNLWWWCEHFKCRRA